MTDAVTRADFDRLPRMLPATKLVADWLLRHPPGRYLGNHIADALAISRIEVEVAWRQLRNTEFNTMHDPMVFDCPANCRWRALFPSPPHPALRPALINGTENSTTDEEKALCRYFLAMLDGFSDAEAREEGWPTGNRSAVVPLKADGTPRQKPGPKPKGAA